MASLHDPITSVRAYNPLGNVPMRYMFGRVLWNNDPTAQGRIKVRIEGLIPFDDYKQLPWIYPIYDFGFRGPLPPTAGDIPTVSSWVLCFFPYNSIYFGFYLF